MKSRFVFPFGIRFQEDGHLDVFPAIEVFIQGQKSLGIRAALHIDSGASVSALPASDAEALGIKMESGERASVRGVEGNALAGYRHTLSLSFQNEVIKKVPVIFVAHKYFPRILGREGVFTKFSIIFDELNNRTIFLDAKKERKAINNLLPKEK